MWGFTTHSALETLRLRLRVTNIAIRCKTPHNPTLVVCYFYILPMKYSRTCKSAFEWLNVELQSLNIFIVTARGVLDFDWLNEKCIVLR